ncbi:MAG: ABC transporter permease [Dehalococcoidales bacterium]|nr:ABC transporter permease [Dehalococcoidales bacterium]
MWRYRELIRNLTVADLKNRYQNTSLGFFWSLLSPFLFSLVLWFVFKNLFKHEENFAINLIVGFMSWRFFSSGTGSCLSSIVGKSSLVTKVFIPRQILVLSTALSHLVSTSLEFVILIPIIFVMLGHLPWTIVLYPFVHVLFFLAIYGIGLILAAFYVYFRDMTQIWTVLSQMLFYTCPIFYPFSVVPPYLLKYYMLNPLTNFIIIYRNIMINGVLPSGKSLLIVGVFAAGFFLIGNYVFSRLQRRFAEEI